MSDKKLTLRLLHEVASELKKIPRSQELIARTDVSTSELESLGYLLCVDGIWRHKNDLQDKP